MGGRAGWLPDQAATEGVTTQPASSAARLDRAWPRLWHRGGHRPSERGADRSAAVGHRQCGGVPDAWV